MARDRRLQDARRRVEATWAQMRVDAIQARGPELFMRRLGIPIDRATYFTLRSIALAGPMTMAALAARHGTDLSTVSRQVRKCEQAGLIHREPSRPGYPGQISVAPDGTKVMRSANIGRHRIFSAALRGWDPVDVKVFAELLDRFSEAYAAEVAALASARSGGAGAAERSAGSAGAARSRAQTSPQR